MILISSLELTAKKILHRENKNMMTVVEAKEYLVANACCQLNKCKKCPFKDSMKCLDVSNKDIIEEAIDKVYEEVLNNAKN